ncbi:MAG: lysostaphin resistance A-like protein [Terriglobales bacterium]
MLPIWPAPDAAPPPAPPPREPAWSGLELAFIVIFTIAAMLVVSAIAVFMWAIVMRATGHLHLPREQAIVGMMLLGQTGGFILGFGFAWLWIDQAQGRRFWQAIHWRKIGAEGVGLALLGGVGLMIVVQALGHVVPMPKNTPEERLFTPHTVWMLALYGVIIAPFFEEFFFRGLLYPTLRATFSLGVKPEELRAWRPLVRVLMGLGVLAVVIWGLREYELVLGTIGPTQYILGAILLVFLAMPQWPIRGVGWILNQMARLHRGEALAIFVTGLLFGLMHAAQLGWAWGAVLILVLVGIVLTVVRARSGSLLPSWLMHCAYNGVLFAAEFISSRGFHHLPH